MKKCLFLILIVFVLSSCQEKNAFYYWEHPKELHKIIQACEMNNIKNANCDQLRDTASTMQGLAYELRLNPQEFGKNILKMQMDIADLETKIQKKPNDQKLLDSLDARKHMLKQRLIIVKRFESPGAQYESFD